MRAVEEFNDSYALVLPLAWTGAAFVLAAFKGINAFTEVALEPGLEFLEEDDAALENTGVFENDDAFDNALGSGFIECVLLSFVSLLRRLISSSNEESKPLTKSFS